jgi:Phosphotransferase enzyme family
MLRLRSIPSAARLKGNPFREDATEESAAADIRKQAQPQKKNPYVPPLPLVLLVLWCTVRSYWNFRHLMQKNLGLEHRKQQPTSLLRANNGSSGNSTHPATTHCPSLPDRLLHHHANLLSPPLTPLTTEQVQQQMKYRKRDRMGTMGDSILTCPNHHRSRVDPNGRIRTMENDPFLTLCRGILKQYQSRAVYQHVKRCLTLLNDTGIAPRLVYTDDDTLTLVEEDKGFLTMRNSPIPVDFDQQLRRILCILRQHSIIHRDLTYPNFIIDEVTGMLYIIDFGDAHVGTTDDNEYWNWRNVQNLFNIWWSDYDEETRMEEFIADTIPEVQGSRQWRPPAHQWSSLNQNKMGAMLLSKELLK